MFPKPIYSNSRNNKKNPCSPTNKKKKKKKNLPIPYLVISIQKKIKKLDPYSLLLLLLTIMMLKENLPQEAYSPT